MLCRMGGWTQVQNRMIRAATALAALGFVAACEAPAPTASNGDKPDVAASSPDTPKQAPVAEARHIVVAAGQSLSRIAVRYGTPQRAIIAANDLTPPYKLKIGQELLIPNADGPAPAPAEAGTPAPEIIPLDRPAVAESTAPPPTTAPPPDVPAVKPLEAAAPVADKSPETSSPAIPAVPTTTAGPPASSASAALPAPATTAAASVPAAPPPPGVTCPYGTTGMWSVDIIKAPVYICRNSQSPS